MNISKVNSAAGEYFGYLPNNIACADGEILEWDNANSRWVCGAKTVNTDTNTNASTMCNAGEYLDGDGTCKAVVASDTNAGTLCNAGEYLDGDGSCKAVVASNTNAQTICTGATFLDGDGNCTAMTVDTNTNADTLCNANEYLDGDGTCKAIPVDTNTNAGTLCNAGEYLDGDTTCKSIPVDTDTTLAGSAAGGDLTGTFPNPTIAAGAVSNTEISDVNVGKIANNAGEYFVYRPNNVACADGQVMQWDNTNSRWVCGAKNG